MAAIGDGERVKGPWSHHEDELLRKLVAVNGPRNWSTISNSIPGRTGKSCRLRWCNQLAPDVARRPFTPEEDDVIIRTHAQVGNKWAYIAKMLHGRTDNAVKNHWNSTIRRRFSRAGAGRFPPKPVQPQPVTVPEKPDAGGHRPPSPIDFSDGYRPVYVPEPEVPYTYPFQFNFQPGSPVQPEPGLDTDLTLSLPGSSSGHEQVQLQEEPAFAPPPPESPVMGVCTQAGASGTVEGMRTLVRQEVVNYMEEHIAQIGSGMTSCSGGVSQSPLNESGFYCWATHGGVE